MPGIRKKSVIQDEVYQPHIDDEIFDEYVRPENYQGSLDAIRMVAKLQAQEEARERESAQVKVPAKRSRRVEFRLSGLQYSSSSESEDESAAVDLGEDRRARLLRLGLDPDLEFPFPPPVGVSEEEKLRLKKKRRETRRRLRESGLLWRRNRNTPDAANGRDAGDPSGGRSAPNGQIANGGSGVLRTRKTGVSSLNTRRSDTTRGNRPAGKGAPSDDGTPSALRRWKSDSDIFTVTSRLKSNLSNHAKGSFLRHSWEKIPETSKFREETKTYLVKALAEMKSLRSVARQQPLDAVRRHSAPGIGQVISNGDQNSSVMGENDDRSIRNSHELMKRRVSSGPATGRRSSISDEAQNINTTNSRRSTVCGLQVRFMTSEGNAATEKSTSPPGSKRSSTVSRFSVSRRGSRPVTAGEMNRLLMKEIARERFRHAIKLVITLVRVFNMIQSRTEKAAQSRDNLTFTEIAEQFQSEDMKNSGLSFNPKDFKANREINISVEVKNILSMASDQRSPEQLQTALYGLQTMKSFAEYPLHMQEKLTKVAWLEHIPPKKIIIRQGHYAEAFYFVISGSAVVTIMETNPNTGETKMRTATVLRKGSSFGELALLHHSVRTATVSSQGPVQLLAIGREDFFDIFMRGQRPGEEPEHITFLRQIDCLKDFPFDKLKEHPEKCLFHFYKRGQVIVKDSNNSEWLYVVKSGTCQVLKKLRAVKPTELRQRGFKLPRIDDSNGGVSSMHNANLLMALAMSPRYQRESPRSPGESPVNPRVSPRNARKGSVMSEKSNQDEARDELMPLPRSAFLTRTRTAEGPSNSTTSQTLTVTSPSASSSSSSFSGSSSSPSPTSSDVDIRKGAVLTKKSYSRSKYRNFPSTQRAHFQPMILQQNNKENDRKRDSSRPNPTDRKERSVFVQLELLHPKHVFGLNTLHFDDDVFDGEQASVYLISRGAECIILHKAFFAKHMNEKVRREVRKVNRPYPTTETLQDHLQEFTNWKHFKKETINLVIEER